MTATSSPTNEYLAAVGAIAMPVFVANGAELARDVDEFLSAHPARTTHSPERRFT